MQASFCALCIFFVDGKKAKPFISRPVCLSVFEIVIELASAAYHTLFLQQVALYGLSKLRPGWQAFVDIMLQ